MTKEQATQLLVSVCEKASKSGLFTLSESSLVLQALEKFGVQPPQVEDLKHDDVEKKVSKTKEIKD
tara:strand:- start:9373 stop:9570 length:198 start_codon:yes stop_codon:yes gene_type:complete